MPRSDDHFHAQLDAAREWERSLAAWIRSRGWYVVPTYDFCGRGEDKAPKLLAPPGAESLVLPDLQCFRDGRAQWLECKWKARADRYRKTQQLTTGISRRLFDHYQRVEERTGFCVVLAFLHEREQQIRGGSLADLERCFSHDYTGERMGRFGMRFWRWLDIPLWAPLAVLSHEAAAE